MRRTLSAVLVCAIWFTSAYGQEPTNNYERMANEQAKEKTRKEIQSRDVPISFYGIVFDQNGVPVSGAAVTIHISQYAPKIIMGIKDIKVVSTNDGRFVVSGERGSSLSVDGIEKYGYEYSRDGSQPDIFNYWTYPPNQPFHSDPINPVVFLVRKKEPPTLVIPGDFHPQLKYNEDVEAVDLVERQSWDIGPNAKYAHPELTQDIHIKVQRNEGGSDCVVTVSTLSSTDGVLMTNEVLYVAPAEGYQQAVEERFPMGVRDQVRHFYVKGRDGKLYARIDATIYAYPERLFFTMRTWANPRGGRNLDYDEELYRQYKREKK